MVWYFYGSFSAPGEIIAGKTKPIEVPYSLHFYLITRCFDVLFVTTTVGNQDVPTWKLWFISILTWPVPYHTISFSEISSHEWQWVITTVPYLLLVSFLIILFHVILYSLLNEIQLSTTAKRTCSSTLVWQGSILLLFLRSQRYKCTCSFLGSTAGRRQTSWLHYLCQHYAWSLLWRGGGKQRRIDCIFCCRHSKQ